MTAGGIPYAAPGGDGRARPDDIVRPRLRVWDVLDRTTYYLGSRTRPPSLLAGASPSTEVGPFLTQWDGGGDIYGFAIAPDSEVRACRFAIGAQVAGSSKVAAGLELLTEGAPVAARILSRERVLFDRLEGTDGLLRLVVAMTPEAVADLPMLVRSRTTLVIGQGTVSIGETASAPDVVWADLDAHRGAGQAARSLVGRIYPTNAGGNITVHGLVREPTDGAVAYESAALSTVAAVAGTLASIGPVDLAGFDAARVRFYTGAKFLGELTLV